MKSALRALVPTTAVLWVAALLFTGVNSPDGFHRILVGTACSGLVLTGLVLVVEHRRKQLGDEIVAKLGSRLDTIADVAAYFQVIGHQNGVEEERERHALRPTVLADYARTRHCGPDCTDCREPVVVEHV